MDLIHPHAKQDVADAVREAAAEHCRLLVVGGRTHMDRGNPAEVDAELWTTMMDEVVAYEPAEMLAVVEAGLRVGDLQRVLAEGGQEWPVDAPHDATVGGVIATGVSSFRRLRLGHVRDTVVELELVRGDGLLVKSGARTVKNVTGYDLHRLATGSLGTLGVIVQVALKLRPLPQVRRKLTLEGDGLELGRRLNDTVPLPSAVIAEPGRARVWLEGWADEVEEQTVAARTIDAALTVDDHPAPFDPLGVEGSTIVEAAVTPSRIPDLVAGHHDWTALLGVGLVWFGLDATEPDALDAIRSSVTAVGGVAPVIRGVGGLGDGTVPAQAIHRRLKESFDPAGIMAPGRFWGER
ncbi:MAG: FAD-binding protein [Actinomycetota bacterium]